MIRLVYIGLIFLSGSLQAQNSSFRFVGPGGGGAQFFPAINPHDNRHLFVACDMGGAYVSYDQGAHWRMFNLVNAVKGFAFDPVQPDVAYTLSTGLFKTSDKGRSWKLIFPLSSQLAALVSKGDHAELAMVTKDSNQVNVVSLAIDPLNRRQLYLLATENRKPFLFSTRDGGLHWKKEKQAPNGTRHVFIDPLSPVANRRLFIAGDSSLLQRKDGNWVSLSLPAGVKKLRDYSAGVDPRSKQFLLYAIGDEQPTGDTEPNGHVYLTTDGGTSWRAINNNLGNKISLRTLATSVQHAGTIYVSYRQLPQTDNQMAAGVARSDDSGNTWQLVWKDLGEKPADNMSADWLNDRFGATWGENPLCLTVAANDPSFCIGTDFGRTIVSTDGGAHWQQVYSNKTDKGWQTRGMEVTTNYDIVRDPNNPQHLFILYTDIGLFESNDGGLHWQSATGQRGIPDAWVNTCYDLVFDKAVKGRAWAAMSGIHDLPRPKMFRRHGTKAFTGGILYTENSGREWRVVSSSIGEGAVTDLLLDENTTVDNRTLYACVFGKGVYKSVDGGKSWQLKNNGIAGNEPFAWRLQQKTNGDLLLIISRRSENGSIGTEGNGSLYLSKDGADSWQKIDLPNGVNGPTSLVTQPGLLLLSAWGRPTTGLSSPDTGGGIYRSTDEGKTWQPVLTSDQHIHDITYDPRNHRYYACGFNSAAYYSNDAGLHWNRIKGYNFKWGKLVRPDPDDPEKIFIITFGGGVWHGPATGDPHAKNDIQPSLQSFIK